MFVSTKPGTREDSKAKYKNLNLPFLQEIYHGDPATPLSCLISQQPAFMLWDCLITGNQKNRFTTDFNHIRQRATPNKSSGISVDKGRYGPSEIFRQTSIKDSMYDLIEFLTIMPTNSLIHSFISQDSQIGNITLQSYNQKYWPWHLQSQTNWDKLAKKYKFNFIQYSDFIDHLSNIDYPNVRDRIMVEETGSFTLDYYWQ